VGALKTGLLGEGLQQSIGEWKKEFGESRYKEKGNHIKTGIKVLRIGIIGCESCDNTLCHFFIIRRRLCIRVAVYERESFPWALTRGDLVALPSFLSIYSPCCSFAKLLLPVTVSE